MTNNYVKNKTGDELLALVGNQKTVTTLDPQISMTVLSVGMVNKAYAFFEELYKQCGVIEAYWFPLRQPNEGIIRDFFVPKQHFGHHTYIQIPQEAYQELDAKGYKLVSNGWMHLHPKFGTGPSSTDRGNNYDTLDKVLHNKLEGHVKTTLKNSNVDVNGEELIFSHILENVSAGIPVGDIAKLLYAFAKKNGQSNISREQTKEFVLKYFAENKSIASFAKYEKTLIRYMNSTVWNSLGKETVLKLDGTEKGGHCSYLTSESLITKYSEATGRWSEPIFLGNLPIKVIALKDDIKFTAQEIKEIVREQIYVPRKEQERLEEITKKALVQKEEPIVAQAQPSTIPAQTVVVDDKQPSILYLILHDFFPKIFPLQETKKKIPKEEIKK